MSYKEFLQRLLNLDSLKNLLAIYHRVRQIPYGSTGNRDPKVVWERNVGSCSWKHILLCDVLREAGFQAEVITMFTYFNESTPIHESFREELKSISVNERVPDFHHYVRVMQQDKWLNLDATWHDKLAEFGFTINNAWSGKGHTKLASVPEMEYPNNEDIVGCKADLVANLPQDQRELRTRYFQLVTK